ncbi:ATP-binding protein [Yinghuangia soli]|uniref:ATP-binding protein n=1 Tax=Yinghuangia soli TaxID=2908204 RepID=A0AA41Q9R4_9ACTN|nr:ATP-binding protein [Yinghuangia soli]MCF2534008.1 ATP-binding protein [Yinghuangia soli]
MDSTALESMDSACLTWSWRLPAAESSVKVARDQVGPLAARCGLDEDMARLVVSELATNCVQHAEESEDFVITVRWEPGRCVIALLDGVPDRLPQFDPIGVDANTTRGRGLLIVAQAADELEVRVGAGCKAVCAVFCRVQPYEPSETVEPLAPIGVEVSDRPGYDYRLCLPPSYPGQSRGAMALDITEAHAMNCIAALSGLRPVRDRVATLLAEGSAVAALLDPRDVETLGRQFTEHIGMIAAAVPTG